MSLWLSYHSFYAFRLLHCAVIVVVFDGVRPSYGPHGQEHGQDLKIGISAISTSPVTLQLFFVPFDSCVVLRPYGLYHIIKNEHSIH